MQLFYPFEIFAKWLTFKVLNLTPASLASEAAEFFIFDTLKIFFLLFTLIFLVAVFRSHLTEARIKKILSHDKKHAGNVLAACLGILVPFCSCSAIPLFLSFLEAGVPVGITFSFLIASPMINEIAVIMLLGLFGVKITLIYILSGLAISIIAGILLGKMHVEKWILSDMIIQKKRANQCACSQGKARVQTAFAYTVSIIRKIGLYVLLGIGVGAWIHGYVPEDF